MISSDDTIENMSPKEAGWLMTGGLLGEVYTAYKFSKDDLMGLSEQDRIEHIIKEVSKSLKDGPAEKDCQIMVIQPLGDGYPLGSFSNDVALYAVVIVPKFPKKPESEGERQERIDSHLNELLGLPEEEHPINKSD